MSNPALLASEPQRQVQTQAATLARRAVPELPSGALRAHLIGASGAGMMSLASVLVARGWRLTASDAQLSSAKWLGNTRVRVSPGHSPRYLPTNSDLVIHSAAVPVENCELRRASQLGIPSVSYAQLLGELQRNAQGLSIAGTHGKSTTTALLAAILVRAGLDPTVVLGGIPTDWQTGGRPGAGPHVLVEACEYRGNLLCLHSQSAVLLNIERDHFDCFRSLEHLESVFAEFARRVSSDGVLVVGDCQRARQITQEATCRVVTSGMQPDSQWRAVNIRLDRGFARFEVWRHGRRFCEARLSVPGEHQVGNAMAAIALAGELGVSAEPIQLAVEEFRGVRRRLQTLGTWNDVVVIDDYAHHPTAVRASLNAVRSMWPGRRIWCVFEPHQASRLVPLVDDFADSLHNADRVLVTQVFAARERHPAEFEAPKQLVEHLRRRGGTGTLVESLDAAKAELRNVSAGDVVVTMGAGDVGKIGYAFVNWLRRNSATG